ncbi:exodeoxyribonuclease VII small subunit [Methylocystis parvus]|uniref:Exodeoxyribonuclease 7 small subunit n=1 Tax=Methylocystis parvus TaxID=134 RepID=A0A6B8M0J9_9HYPH|nr:exodeoxyribonuclease VII small subunit [Methylocystis parvus]QGM98317.1 exodeoxyribonuclease VII small subunit [Methylocystis parvus]WBK01355.1 exodeoxyribonuclease VII small subunit [Methylocystis parvus OBBP]
MTETDKVGEDAAALPFEKAMAELERIVAELEKGSVSLDDSVRLYARGKALQERCEKLLAEAETRVEKITLGANGAPKGVAPLDVE